MNINSYREYFGLAYVGKEVIIKRSFDLINNIAATEVDLTLLRRHSLNDIMAADPAELYRSYSNLLKYKDKLVSYKDEYPCANLSPYIEIFYKILDQLVVKKSSGRIYSIKPLCLADQKISLRFTNYYRFEVASYCGNDLLTSENEQAFKQLLTNLKNSFSSEEFKSSIRARQQSVDKSNSSCKKFIEKLFLKHKIVNVVSIVTYLPFMDIIFNDNFFIDKADATQQLKIEWHAAETLSNKLKQLAGKECQQLQNERATLIRKARQEETVRQQNRQEKCILAVLDMKDDFITQIRKEYRKNLIGFVWKVEHTKSAGFYIRFNFFFHSSLVDSDQLIADNLGQIWAKKVTKDGVFQNDNLRNIKGVGLVSISDQDSFEALKLRFSIMAKSDYFIDLRIGNRRTMGKSKP